VSREFATQVSLSSIVLEPRAEPRAPLAIALHGWGMSEGHFLRWLRPGIDHLPDLGWWLPRGILPGQVKSKRIGYGWYVYDGDQQALLASMNEARAYLVGLAEMARRRLDPERITLVGFSQGGYLASYVALSRPDLFDRLAVCLARPKTEFIEDLEAARGVEVLVLTGARDSSVTPELIGRGVDPLRAAGLAVTVKSYDAEHRLTPRMATDVAEFAR